MPKESQFKTWDLSLNLLLLAATVVVLLFQLVLTLVTVLTLVGSSGNPETRLTFTGHALVLAREIKARALHLLAAALGESARASRDLGADSGVGLNPVGESVLAVLDDAVAVVSTLHHCADSETMTYDLEASYPS